MWNEKYKLTNQNIIDIAENINISSKDIDSTVDRIEKWVKEVTWKNNIKNIWFINNS